MTYDPAIGNVASITDPMGTVTAFAYDAAGNRLSIVEDTGPGRAGSTARRSVATPNGATSSR